MNWIESLGLLAAFCTTFSFLPQAVRSIRTRNTRDLSLWMYLLFVTGVLLWLVYGILIDKWPIIIGNSITLFFAGTILLLKIRHTLQDRS